MSFFKKCLWGAALFAGWLVVSFLDARFARGGIF